ncbi:phage major tail tube protein, partial [Escherichia coli]|uniref:phage major tail tube protein n=1 Tax=Escherichia coli TaxID=562 RepID=UPI002F96B8F8
LAADVIISQKRIGNLPAVRVPYFPADAMLITKLENLSIYYMDAVPIRFAGSYQRDDTGETVAVEVVMRGRQKEIDTGEGKQGEDTESKISVVCTYFRLTMDGKELVEIDTINMIEK